MYFKPLRTRGTTHDFFRKGLVIFRASQAFSSFIHFFPIICSFLSSLPWFSPYPLLFMTGVRTHQLAVPLRGQPPDAAGRGGPRLPVDHGGHPHRHPQPESLQDGGQEHVAARLVQVPMPMALDHACLNCFGCWGCFSGLVNICCCCCLFPWGGEGFERDERRETREESTAVRWSKGNEMRDERGT